MKNYINCLKGLVLRNKMFFILMNLHSLKESYERFTGVR